MRQRILVTGATGFIGRHVVDALLRQGHTVLATVHSSPVPDDWKGQVAIIPLDLNTINDEVDYFEQTGRPDRLIHLAWQGLPRYKELFHIEQNLWQHYRFLKSMVRNGLTDLTVTGTCFEYGMQEGCLSENLPAMPGNAYAVAKDSLRRFLEILQKDYPFALKWMRLFYMYGPGQHAGSLFPQLEQAIKRGDPVFNMSGGAQVRDYLPVEQVAAVIVKAGLQQQVTGIINCCSGVPVTVKEMVLLFLKNQNASISLNLGYYPYPDYEPMAFWGDAQKLNTLG